MSQKVLLNIKKYLSINHHDPVSFVKSCCLPARTKVFKVKNSTVYTWQNPNRGITINTVAIKAITGKTSQAIIAQVVPSADMLGSQHTDSTGRKAGIYYLLQNPPPKHPYKNRNSCDNNHNQAHTNSYTHAIPHLTSYILQWPYLLPPLLNQLYR